MISFCESLFPQLLSLPFWHTNAYRRSGSLLNFELKVLTRTEVISKEDVVLRGRKSFQGQMWEGSTGHTCQVRQWGVVPTAIFKIRSNFAEMCI